MKKVLFMTGTRADYGKLKSLMRCVDDSPMFQAYIYVSGMHLLTVLGDTYEEVLKDRYENIQVAYGLANTRVMSYDLGNVICDLTGYVRKVQPDLIVVHGDRIDALAGAVVGALNNIRVAHIEGGEVSGTIDESIRHAISKFSHIHLVANEEAKRRLVQLGENEGNIFIIGSPDIDIMLSNRIPEIDKAKERYEVAFDHYGILMYHPVTTQYNCLYRHIKEVVDGIISSNRNFIVIYPNNDLGYELILNEYRRFDEDCHFRVFPSLRFEYFLSFLRSSSFIIGNSSAGVREASIYGIPAIDIGERQTGRYDLKNSKNIQHIKENMAEIVNAINNVDKYRCESRVFGNGDSTQRFMEIISSPDIWNIELQKHFYELNW